MLETTPARYAGELRGRTAPVAFPLPTNDKARRWAKTGRVTRRSVLFVALVVGSFLALLPLLWMLSTSLKPNSQILVFPPQWVPNPLTWAHYADVINQTPIGLWFENTGIITVTTVVGATASSSLVAYGFARLRARGSTILFWILLSTMMMPGIVLLLPQFIMFSYINWTDTFLPLIVPAFFAYPFYVFLLRQFFVSFPKELEDAAKIDGVGWFSMWWRMIVPNSRAVHATVAIFQFMAAWNDFMAPYVYLTSGNKTTLALGTEYFLNLHNADWGPLMAYSCVMVLPMLLVFAFSQRFFVRSISTTGFGGR